MTRPWEGWPGGLASAAGHPRDKCRERQAKDECREKQAAGAWSAAKRPALAVPELFAIESIEFQVTEGGQCHRLFQRSTAKNCYLSGNK